MRLDNFGTPRINFAGNLCDQVANTYLKHLSNKMYFKMKLSCLSVKNYETSDKTDGSFWNDVDSNELKIILSICPTDSKKYIAFIIAHEMAHLLMCSVSDALVVSRKVSAVIRLNEDGISYGDRLEELLADYIAHFIVSKMDLEDENGQYEEFKKRNEGKIKLISKLEQYFGNSLMDLEFIDYTAIKPEEERIHVLREYEEETQYSANLLWYSVANDSFDKIIEIFNEGIRAFEHNEMVEEPFEKLCNSIEGISFKTNDPDNYRETFEYLELGFGA